MDTPIEKFNNISEAIEVLEEWKERLGLFDWTIKLKLCEPHEFVLQDCDGECEYIPVIKTAVIRILKPEYYGDRIQKYCAERILIHELLHCKLGVIERMTNIDDLLHQTHEDIAISLLCAKYNIKRNWLNNIDYQ